MATVKAKQPDQGAPDRKHNIEAMRQDYYARISQHGMTPLWKVMGTLFRDEPVSRCAPAVWHFDDVKSLVMEAGGLITAEEAKRRVLILENPALRGELRVTNTLFAGIQMIMPGEIAPAHRHVSSAIRFVLDGEGAYTAVEGEKAFMSPGDFVITANWAPHDHGNPSDKPMLWLDVLDAPAINFYETSFGEDFGSPTQETTRRDGDSLSFYGSGVLPDGTAPSKRTPIINYTYARTRPIIERMMAAGDIDKSHGARVRYANPSTGGPVLPTMGANLACCQRASAASLTVRPTAPSSPAPRGGARRPSMGKCWNGARAMSSSCRRGSATPTPPPRSRCCSRSRTARRRKRSASGGRRGSDLLVAPGLDPGAHAASRALAAAIRANNS